MKYDLITIIIKKIKNVKDYNIENNISNQFKIMKKYFYNLILRLNRYQILKNYYMYLCII